MLEWLVVPVIEVGKWAFAELGKPALESYVQGFFKACLSGGVSRLHATALKAPMKEALGYFINRWIKALLNRLWLNSTYSEKLDISGDRSLNDPDEQLREWAQEQLEKLKMEEA